MIKRIVCATCSFVALAILTGCGSGLAQTQGPKGDTGPAGPPGLIYLGAYSTTTAYVPTDVVTYNGSSYVAVANSTNVSPVGAAASAADWNVLALAGSSGPAGSAGPQGLQGPQGVQGFTGVQGPQGVAGLKGEPGSTGLQGVVGPTGPIGVQGPQGVPGTSLTAAMRSPFYGKTMGIMGDSYCVFNLFQ